MQNFLIGGNGGREASLAERIVQDEPETTLNAVVEYENPTIVGLVERTGGQYEIGDFTDPGRVAAFAVRTEVDLAVVSNDNALENGVADALRSADVPTVGPGSQAARVEWDKAFAREFFNSVDPTLNPPYRLVKNGGEINEALSFFHGQNKAVVVKPLGLTGGKGVQVMGPHFKTYDDARQISEKLLDAGNETVLLEEKIDSRSVEYTVQAWTDGKTVIDPLFTVDYPYRFDGDKGPGTGGMGVFTERGQPSYLSASEVERTKEVVHDLLGAMRAQNLDFSGTLSAGFFATPQGLQIIETNARPGDPECLNMTMLVEGNFTAALKETANQELTPSTFSYKDAASVLVYLVNKNYALNTPSEPASFTVDHDRVERTGAQLFFAAAKKGETEGKYVTVGTSRALAIGALGEDLKEAYEKVYKAIEEGVRGPLDYRRDIGDAEYVAGLAKQR